MTTDCHTRCDTETVPETEADRAITVDAARRVLSRHVADIITTKCRDCGETAPCTIAQAAQLLLRSAPGNPLPAPRRPSAALTAD